MFRLLIHMALNTGCRRGELMGGHTQLKTTNRYVHAVEQAERQAANTLELLLGGNRKTGVR